MSSQTQYTKPWIANNTTRDSTAVMLNKKSLAYGQRYASRLNLPSHTNNYKYETEHNSRINALTRVRAGGANVPKKVTHKGMTNLGHIFY